MHVTYRLESAGDITALADKIASDQSTGMFTELPGETRAVRARWATRVISLRSLEPIDVSSIPDHNGAG